MKIISYLFTFAIGFALSAHLYSVLIDKKSLLLLAKSANHYGCTRYVAKIGNGDYLTCDSYSEDYEKHMKNIFEIIGI